MGILSGKILEDILEIEISGKFDESIILPGCNEVVGYLTDFERAIHTYIMNIFKSKMEQPKKEFQISILSGLFWFLVVNRLNLWDKPLSYGINKGKTIVIVDKEAVAEMLGLNMTGKKISSIDELPQEVREALVGFVLSSKSFKKPDNPTEN